MREIERFTNRFLHGFESLNCLGCGKEIILEFNGGELDSSECCGYKYSGEHRQMDIVVYKTNEPQCAINPENWFNSKCPKCKKGSLVAHPPQNKRYTHFCIGRDCDYQRPKHS